MANASFTRDEVILALDVLYFSEVPHPTVQTKVMQELSAQYNRFVEWVYVYDIAPKGRGPVRPKGCTGPLH